jgi:hypothetical protein
MFNRRNSFGTAYGLEASDQNEEVSVNNGAKTVLAPCPRTQTQGDVP